MWGIRTKAGNKNPNQIDLLKSRIAELENHLLKSKIETAKAQAKSDQFKAQLQMVNIEYHAFRLNADRDDKKSRNFLLNGAG